MAFVLQSPSEVFEDPSSLERRIEAVEEQSLSRSDYPAIVVIGSSRAAFSVIPDVIDGNLGLPLHSTINAGYPGSGVRSFNMLLDRNPQLLSNKPLVFIFTDEYFLFENTPTESDASPAVRIENTLLNELRNVTGLSSRLTWVRHHFLVDFGLAPRVGLWMWNVDDRGFWCDESMRTSTLLQDPDRTNTLITAIAQSYYGQKKISPTAISDYESFVLRVKQTGCRVILLHPPTYPTYHELVRKTYGSLQAAHSQAFAEIAQRTGVPWFYFDDAQQCGLEAEHFADAVHLTHEGAEHFSRFLAKLIETKALLHDPKSGLRWAQRTESMR